jgi:membrane fusion protein, multidrug efflux system
MTEATFDAASSKTPTRQTFTQTHRRTLFRMAGGAAVLLAAGYGVHWWLATRFIEATDNAYVRADVVTISSRISGYIAAVAVSDNQPVHRGDVLVQIDPAIYGARADQAAASVAAAQADVVVETAAVATFDAQIAQQQSLIAQAQAEISVADADAHRASLELQRQQTLAERQISSLQRLEATVADQKKAAAALAGTEAAFASQRARLAVLVAERQGKGAALDKARATLNQMQAALALATIDLDNATIRAPVDGIVGQRVGRIGQYVDPGQPLLAVVPADAAYVVANFKETQLGRIAIGQPAELDVDALDGESLQGRVDSFAPASGAQFALLPPDNATGNFTKIVQRMPIRITIDPGQRHARTLRPGMSVVARIDTRRPEGASHER